MSELMKFDPTELKELNSLSVLVDAPKSDISVHDGVISAQRVAVRRDEANVMSKVQILGKVNGDSYYYGWFVNDKKLKKKVWIEGPTIKMAMDLARVYGNNQIDVRVIENAESWIFYARFVDIETGYSITRAFQQRKSQRSQDTDDIARQQDMAFQIGQSKAIRNVIIAALGTFADVAMAAAKESIIKRFEKNIDGAREAIRVLLTEMAIDHKRVEENCGLSTKDWTPAVAAKVWEQIQAIKNGVASLDEVFPSKDQKHIENKPAQTLDDLEKSIEAAPIGFKLEAEKPAEPVKSKQPEPAKETAKPQSDKIWKDLHKKIKLEVNQAKSAEEVNNIINVAYKVTLADMKEAQPSFHEDILDCVMDKQHSFHKFKTEPSNVGGR